MTIRTEKVIWRKGMMAPRLFVDLSEADLLPRSELPCRRHKSGNSSSRDLFANRPDSWKRFFHERDR